MSLSLRQLVQLSRDLQGKSEATVDRALNDRHFSPEERISVKHALSAAAAEKRSLAAKLATDDAEYSINRQPASETQQLLVKSGFRLGQRYGETDVDHLLHTSALDPTQRIACRLELRELGMMAAGTPKSHQIFNMRASADKHPRGTRLTDASGQPVTLRSLP